ncbi:MAG: acyl-CoA thioesterase-like protein [Ilumatobacteraceae bacterium]|nr:acyl-CoA thioesterase-like protein [Ilumatobacteraceae bacterium]MCU1387192.1 acyl-CoA thioesterase-like protein [Ilumatobacteraceae bacterium]
MTPFASATTVARSGEGTYRGAVDESWTLRPLPQGGLMTAVALRAMEDALGDPAQCLRTMHTLFVGQVAQGELEIEVDVLRRGRSMSHVRAEIRNPGAASGHITTAVFGRVRDGFEFTELRRPDVPAPDDCPSFRDPPPPGTPVWTPMPFWATRVEGRAALGVAPWEVVEHRTAEQATWYRLDDPPWLDDGVRIDPLSIVMLADIMPGAIGQRLGPTARPWFGPSVDLTVHVFGDCHSPWVLAHNTARWAGDGYASIDQAIWDGDRLIAYATQVSYFTFPESV